MEVRSEPFPAVMHKNPVQSQPPMSNMRLTFTSDGTSIYKQVPSAPPPYQSSGTAAPLADAHPNPPSQQHGLSWSSRDPGKRKRGRPKKYGSDGAMKFTSTAMQTSPVQGGGSAGFASPMVATSPPVAPPAGLPAQLGSAGAAKKARSRPQGSLKKHQMSGLGSAGTGFTAHVLTVKAGEDVSSVIMSFLQHGSRALCILSANGAISNVTLRQAAISGGTVTYEGRFEILSLSGSFIFSESGGQRSRTGGLSISLAGPDGRVLGGGVAGILTAATPVQVVVGSFIAEQKKEVKDSNPVEPGFSPRPLSASNAGASSPPSRGTLSESSGGPGSPPHQNAGYNNGNQRPISSMPSWK